MVFAGPYSGNLTLFLIWLFYRIHKDRDESDSINLREGFHSPQVMHGMGEMTQFVFSSVNGPTDEGSGEEKETEMQNL